MQLQRILPQIVLAGIAISLAGCTDASEPASCTRPAQHTFSITTPADPAVQFCVEGCRVDVDACDALCTVAFERGGVDVGRLAGITSCTVEFRGAAVSVKVGYDVYADQQLCPVAGGAPPLAPR